MTPIWNMLADPLISPLRRSRDALQAYDRRTLRADLLAGLTVSVVAIPQAMAYALIAQVPAEYGLYTVIFHCLIGSMFNSQPLLSTGPTNTQALLIASITTRMVAPDLPEDQRIAMFVQLAIVLSLVKGVIQIVLAEARLGNLVKFVSHSVIVGFSAGAGVLIAGGQIHSFLGFATQRTAEQWPGVVGIAQRLAPHLGEISPWAVGVGLLSLAIVLGSRKLSRMFPGPLIAIVVAALCVFLFDLTHSELTRIRPLPDALPMPAAPNWSLLFNRFDGVLSGAFALALMGMMEAYSVGKAIANKTNTSVSANQEMFSQGLTNFVGSFLNCIPGSGSFARSALNHYMGARTFLAGVFNGLFILIIFLLFAPAAQYIPMTAIAAILFVIAYGLIDFAYLRRVVRTSRADTWACLGTFVATLIFPLAYAVFVGIFLNIALYLRRSSTLHVAEMVRSPGGPFIERPLTDRTGRQKVTFLQVEGDLFFGVADDLQETLFKLANSPGLRCVILRMKRTHWIDTTVLTVLEQFVMQMRERGKHVVLCGLRENLHHRLQSFGLAQQVGEDNIFESSYGVFTSAKRAIQRAKVLVGSSIDADILADVDDEMEGWAYEI